MCVTVRRTYFESVCSDVDFRMKRYLRFPSFCRGSIRLGICATPPPGYVSLYSLIFCLATTVDVSIARRLGCNGATNADCRKLWDPFTYWCRAEFSRSIFHLIFPQQSSLLSLLNTCEIRHHFERVLSRFSKLYSRKVILTYDFVRGAHFTG